MSFITVRDRDRISDEPLRCTSFLPNLQRLPLLRRAGEFRCYSLHRRLDHKTYSPWTKVQWNSPYIGLYGCVAERMREFKVTGKTKASANPLICVVDDDPSVADSTRYLIDSFGFRSKAFASAREFLSSRHVQEVSCLILDICMPEMDGLELQHRLAETNQRVPIVFLTAHVNESEEKRAMEGGAVAVLHKPVSEVVLFNAIQAALGR